MRVLRFLFVDQLSLSISSLRDVSKKDDIILLVESREEATYVKHHKKKLILWFSAMRHFANELEKKGFSVVYMRLDDAKNKGSLIAEVERISKARKCNQIVVTEPSEYRQLKDLQGWEKAMGVYVEIRTDDRFIATHEAFEQWAAKRKELTMEYFYREMRKKTGLLMHHNKPEGGKWNYDKDNRKPLPKGRVFPQVKQAKPSKITQEVIKLVNKEFKDHFGKSDNFWFAVTCEDAGKALKHFIAECLPSFGTYQDAMKVGEPFLYHSIISMYINCGLLDPMTVCLAAENAYYEGKAPLNAVEGFIRQIIGWREFIRGIYWLYMPEYSKRNELKAKRKLPQFFWDAQTDMKCISEVVKFTHDEAYSHHIQRLMITGNFALLAGLDVKEVCEWYLIVYADAYDWVELPNTLGMALHADGGVVGTKPYISSGAYINRMSDFCQHCKYDVKKKTGETACPYNYLYWNFMIQHEEVFKDNMRMKMAYNNLNRLSDSDKKGILESSKKFLKELK